MSSKVHDALMYAHAIDHSKRNIQTYMYKYNINTTCKIQHADLPNSSVDIFWHSYFQIDENYLHFHLSCTAVTGQDSINFWTAAYEYRYSYFGMYCTNGTCTLDVKF